MRYAGGGVTDDVFFRVPRGSRVHILQAFACCPLAGAVTSRIHDYVEQNGHVLVDDPAEADVQIVNTCGSDAGKAQLTFDALARIRDAAPESALIVAGCLVNIEPKRLREATRAVERHALLDPRHLGSLDSIFQPEALSFERVPHSLRSRYGGNPLASGWHHVTVGTGCFGKCSFCAIRRATGRPRSRSIPEILDDVRRGVAAGIPDILLVGTDVSAWGADLGLTVVDLLRAVTSHPEESVFAVESLEPTLFLEHLDEILPLLATKRFSILALPIQSGSQRVLDRMRRTYRIDEVLRAIERVRAVDPEIVLRTDVIYGFGDETREELEATLAVLGAFDQVGFNVYQPRPGTPELELPASELADRGARVMEVHRARTIAPARAPRRIKPAKATDDNGIPWSPDEVVEEGLVTLRRSRTEAPPLLAVDEGHARWLRDLADRIGRIVLRRGELQLGGGFRTGAPRVDSSLDALVLECTDASGERFSIALRRRDRPGNYAAISDRFAAFVPEDGGPRTRDAAEALRVLMSALGLATRLAS